MVSLISLPWYPRKLRVSDPRVVGKRQTPLVIAETKYCWIYSLANRICVVVGLNSIHMFDRDGFNHFNPSILAAKPPFDPSWVDHVFLCIFRRAFHVLLSNDPDLLVISHDAPFNPHRILWNLQTPMKSHRVQLNPRKSHEVSIKWHEIA